MRLLKIVCISDTHSRHDALEVPDGDILIHAGDFSVAGDFFEIRDFNDWLGTLPHKHKIVIAGNHDLMFERDPDLARSMIFNGVYLQDAMVEVEGLRIYGSPWQPRFNDWAFNLDRGEPLRRKWAMIPKGIDVLVTHGPPHSVLDRTFHGEAVGCEELRLALDRVKPRLHVFGHVHHGYGEGRRNGTRYVNASSCDEAYRPLNKPITVELATNAQEN